MKKNIFSYIFAIATILILGSCASTNNTVNPKKIGLVSKPDSKHFTIPKEQTYSYIEYSDDLKTATFEGKEYDLELGDEFDEPFRNWQKWRIDGGFADSEARCNDGSWLGSKVIGTSKFDKIFFERQQFTDDTVYGEKAFYTEDGVLHMKQIRKKIGNDWHVFLPDFQSMDVIERGCIIEIRYKFPVKGRCTVIHSSLNLDYACVGCEYNFNDKGWTFQQLYLGEFLTGVPNQIRYGSSIWLGKNQKSTSHDIDYAIPDHHRNLDVVVDYNTKLNMNDDNSEPYWRYDDDFYEWHTATIIYDDEKFANYQDGLLTYEWKWADHPECGMPQDAVFSDGTRKTGAGKLEVWYGLSGDWAAVEEPTQKAYEKKWVGDFGDTDESFDLQLDYVRIYRQKK